MDKKKYQAIIFFILGGVLFWYVYRDLELKKLDGVMNELRWTWITVSLGLNLLSHLVRAYRWRMLIRTINYAPGVFNLFLSNLVLAFTNLVIPRGGEIARLGVVYKYEKIPFVKLLGTALVERLTDLVILLLIGVFLVFWQYDKIISILSRPEISFELNVLNTILVITGSAVFVAAAIYILFVKLDLWSRIRERFRKTKHDIKEGFDTLARLRNKTLYIIYSLFTWVLWMVMLYVLFFAYPPTQGLSFTAAAFTFGFSALAFLIPVQAGIGTWHFLVIQSLVLFGIGTDTGSIFALVSHSFTMMVYLLFGAVALILLPLVNKS